MTFFSWVWEKYYLMFSWYSFCFERKIQLKFKTCEQMDSLELTFHSSQKVSRFLVFCFFFFTLELSKRRAKGFYAWKLFRFTNYTMVFYISNDSHVPLKLCFSFYVYPQMNSSFVRVPGTWNWRFMLRDFDPFVLKRNPIAFTVILGKC